MPKPKPLRVYLCAASGRGHGTDAIMSRQIINVGGAEKLQGWLLMSYVMENWMRRQILVSERVGDDVVRFGIEQKKAPKSKASCNRRCMSVLGRWPMSMQLMRLNKYLRLLRKLVHRHTIQLVGNIFLHAFSGSACARGQYKLSISTGGHLRAATINLLHRRLS